MPTYEYQCKSCSHRFDLFQSITAPVKRKCPKCGKSALERLIGVGAGIIFKGGGFYETDYRSETYRKAAEAETKAAERKSDAKSDSKSDSKPESKSRPDTKTPPQSESNSAAKVEKRPPPKSPGSSTRAKRRRPGS